MVARIDRFDVTTPDGVAHACAALHPGGDGPHRLCLFLYGGGGGLETLEESRPLWESWFAEGLLPPMLVATAAVRPFGFWLDEPDHLEETLWADALPAAVGARYPVSGRPLVLGISMGGHAALAGSFARPGRFAAVAALQPMVEPGWDPDDSPRRCRQHYPPGIPERLLGARRDAEVWRAEHPAWRARRHAMAWAQAPAPLWIEAAGADRFHAQEGALFLHEALVQLGIAHTFTVSEGADHVGPSVVPRLTEAARWLGSA